MRVATKMCLLLRSAAVGGRFMRGTYPPPHHITSLRPLSLRFSTFLMCSFWTWVLQKRRWQMVCGAEEERSVAPCVGCCMH